MNPLERYWLTVNGVRINLANLDINEIELLTEAGVSKFTNPANAMGIPMVMPVRMKLATDSDWWLLPHEPFISVSGGNVVARRNVAKSKGRGTIKERWSQDDYRVTIKGLFMNLTDIAVYPEEDVARLRALCEAREIIEVDCELFRLFGIDRMAIDTYDFPFSKGENIQGYIITGYSDDIAELLIEENVL
ncbi:MAG: DUF6046 domain-containing protein [Bacteroidales bacterium]